jgi:hypothetical protein
MSNVTTAQRKKRIVWMGESVATGYFYGQRYSPAMALENALKVADPRARFDIIDQAQSGIRFKQWLPAMHDAKSLEPDAVIFFAGNNWRYNPEVNGDEKARYVRQHGLSGVFALEARVLQERACTFIRYILELFVRANIRVVVIIPEFNLLDYGPAIDVAPPWLPNGVAASWTDLRQRALLALASGDYLTARQSAVTLRTVEEDATGVGAHLLGRSLVAVGDNAGARKALEVARDRLDCPRLGSAGETALRNTCLDAGIVTLDLPREFERLQGGSVPDRTLFHDYCHMTGKGIAFTACRAAEILTSLLFGDTPKSLSPEQFEPEPEVEAQAHLLAGCYTATFRQSNELIGHHFSWASQIPRLRDAISLLADGHLRREIPFVMSRSWMGLLQDVCPELAEFLQDSLRERPRRLDGPIYHAAIKHCTEQRNALSSLAAQEHGLVSKTPMDLLSDTYVRHGTPVEWKGRVLRGLSARTEFVFWGTQAVEAEVTIAWRASHNVRPGTAEFAVNGTSIMTAWLTSTWLKSTMTVPAGQIRDGLNILTINWPGELTAHPGDIREDLASIYESRFVEAEDLFWNETRDLCKLPKGWRPSFGHIDVLAISVLPA